MRRSLQRDMQANDVGGFKQLVEFDELRVGRLNIFIIVIDYVVVNHFALPALQTFRDPRPDSAETDDPDPFSDERVEFGSVATYSSHPSTVFDGFDLTIDLALNREHQDHGVFSHGYGVRTAVV